MKSRIIALLFCVLPCLIFGQGATSIHETKNARRSLQIAQDQINKGKYHHALKQLQHTVKLKANFAVAHLELGRVQLILKRYSSAVASFEQSFKYNPHLSRAGYYECSEAYFHIGEIQEAQNKMERFEQMKTESYANKGKEDATEEVYNVLYKERRTSHDFLLKGDYPKMDELVLRPMGININSSQDEYLPTLTADGLSLVFTRTKEDGNQDLMIANKTGDTWIDPVYFDSSINTDENEGMARFTADNSRLYFAGCMRDDTEGGCDIYWAQFASGNIEDVSRIGDNLNSNRWDSQPSITCDGKTLYFSSTREGGYGGADIYYSTLGYDDTWSYPTNLGPEINTAGDEEAPFISSDGRTLYFTSTGLPGMGDGDLFIARWMDHSWTRPQNMGVPINSQGKELGIYVQADGKTINFSSAREGGQGGLDLYETELPAIFRPESSVHVEGFIKDKETGNPIACELDITRADRKFKVKTDPDGRFFICLPANQAFSFQTQPDGYAYHISAEFFESNDNRQSHKVELLLNKQRKKVKPTYAQTRELKERRIQLFFGFDSHEVTENTKSDLEELIGLLEKEDWWKVEVIGYADSSGSAEYNQTLSERRANTIVNYLQSKGITTKQVYKKGQGSAEGDSRLARRVDVRLHR